MSLINDKPTKGPSGKDVSGGKRGGYWASSNYDENEKTAKFRDKKFEGYSQLKAGGDFSKTGKRDTYGSADDQALKQLEEEYILNLQKQIALMEQELKLLKEREIEQNKSAAGYEVLLKDGIPVNEHFIALKNKYNVERDNWEKKLTTMDEDNKTELKNNREKQHKIEILNHEFEVISDRYNYFKDETNKRIEDLQAKIFNERNTIDHLRAELDELQSKFNALETENAQLERLIARNKMFNKKADELKQRKEITDKRDKKMRELNEEIAKHNLLLLQQKMKLEDKDLIKKQNEEVLRRTQEFSKIDIELNIAKSRIKELEGVKHMNIRILQDIYTEIRDLEKDEHEMAEKLEKKPDAVGDAKFREEMEVREKERTNELQSQIKADREHTEDLLETLKDEEGKAKDMLDEKVRLENELKLNNEDLEKQIKLVHDNDGNIIALLNRKDILESQKERLTKEVGDMTLENTDYQAKNDELEAENAQLEEKIRIIKQKIDVNTLLKEVNIEDFIIAAKNNQTMMALIKRLESIGWDDQM